MYYEITILRKTIEELPEGRKWTKLADGIMTKEDYEKSGIAFTEEVIAEPRAKSIYGYTPEITVHGEVERIILQQTVECLDLAAVSCAINKIPYEDS